MFSGVDMKLKVVVVDDNFKNLIMEKDLLEVAGFSVFKAETAQKGIALVKKIIPDVIIMDVRLPDMMGFAAARLIRLDETIQGIPIIFVTASVLAEGREELKNIGNSFFIGKPINTRTFAIEVRQRIK